MASEVDVEAILAVECPRCYACAGRPCWDTTPGADGTVEPHESRREHASLLARLRAAELVAKSAVEQQEVALARAEQAEKDRDEAMLDRETLLARLRETERVFDLEIERARRAEQERDEARERESYALAAIERNDEVHAEAIRAVRQRAERAEQTRDAHAEALAQAAREAEEALDRIAALTVERDEARAALATVNDIRNSIIGAQTVNWSEHVYPLVAALDAAGVAGMPYPEARENVGTLIERANKAEARVAELEAAKAAAGEAWGHVRAELATLRAIADAAADAEKAAPEDAEVRQLGERIGFGALMSAAEKAWREWRVAQGMPVGSEFVVGPCRATVDAVLATLRAALAARGKDGG